MLIAESGSSKTDWKWLPSGKQFQTPGYNPYVQGMDNLLAALEKDLPPDTRNSQPKEIFFYGSGFSHPEFNEALRKWLRNWFQAESCAVEHDLLGASRAICLDQPGIAVILGTGSNSCLYDGRSIVSTRGGHGYLFGDEGSGADLGKRLVKGILDQDFSPDFTQMVLNRLECGHPVELRNRIHGKPRPNVALAALAPLVLESASYPEAEDIILESLRSFCHLTLLRYPEIQTLPIGFTGSIALYFKPWLERVLEEFSLKASIIVDRPVERLALYHERFQ